MKTFVDTSPFIYLVENHPEYANLVKQFMLQVASNHDELVTSVITLMEFGIMPERQGRQELILQFEAFLRSMHIPLEEIDHRVAETAYKLRAKYDFLKGMDALQIAVAIEKACDQFLTNDKKLQKISEVQMLMIEDI